MDILIITFEVWPNLILQVLFAQLASGVTQYAGVSWQKAAINHLTKLRTRPDAKCFTED